MQVATGPLHQAVENFVPALLIGVLYSVFSTMMPCFDASLYADCRILTLWKKSVEVDEDGTMLCNASTGDGGGAYVESTVRDNPNGFRMDSNGDSE